MRILHALLICALIYLAASSKPKRKLARGAKRTKSNDAPSKRKLVLQAESLINIQLVHATYTEIGFSYIQGAEGFLVTAKEWIDNSFEQSVATDTQYLGVQKRSAVLKNLIPGREYLIQVQATSKNKKPFGIIAGKIVRTAQKCYICNGVGDNEDCDKESDVIECPHDKDACENVIRYDNSKMAISKRCAQYNPKFTKPCDKAENEKDSSCRCMCRSNKCNKVAMPCADECLDELPMPSKSTIRCTNGGKVGSVCKWGCDPGYMIKGLAQTICRKDRTWSVMSPPNCTPMSKSRLAATKPTPRRRTKRPPVAKLCKPIEDENAVIKCTNGDEIKSVCTSTCKSGFKYLSGSKSRTCGKNQRWTGTPIVCEAHLAATKPTPRRRTRRPRVAKLCKPIADDNADVKCTNGHEIKSVCTSTCKSGFKYLGGSKSRACGKNRQWTGTPIVCEEIKCESPFARPNFAVCTNDTKVGSVCDVRRPSKMICQSDGSWLLNDARAPFGLSDMEPIGPPCEELKPPRFGDLICTNENQANSLCEYACAKGYVLAGKTRVRECKNGEWTGQPITCEEVTCSNLHEKPYVKEVVDCSNSNKIGSVCNVITPTVVACQSDGSWTLPMNLESKCKECTCP